MHLQKQKEEYDGLSEYVAPRTVARAGNYSCYEEDEISTVGGEIPELDELEGDIYDDSDIDSEFEDNSLDRLGNLLSSVLVNEEGETVCSALVNISRQLEVQNKIMIKLLSQLQKQV